ncbi:FixH family protein [Mesorhizobium sp. M0119]|uniref:FixH family protein n=1 Tax=Mesorhizobium sp. M0119 TaxID=2956885 RepID=UPI00333D8B0D
MIIIVDLKMAVLASRSWTGFVVNNSHVASQEFNLNAQEGRAQAALDRDGAPPCNRKWRDPLPPEGLERQDAQASGVKRTMVTGPDDSQRCHDVHQPRPSARMHIESPGPRFSADAKRVMFVQNLTGAETCRLQYNRPSWHLEVFLAIHALTAR